MRKNFQCFFIKMIWIGHDFCTFPANDLDLVQITLLAQDMTHPYVISNLYMKLVLPMFIHKKDVNRTRVLHKQTDKLIPIYPPPHFVCGGNKNFYNVTYTVASFGYSQIVPFLWPCFKSAICVALTTGIVVEGKNSENLFWRTN